MTWCAYQVILRLRSPLHIGCGKVGNLQRTRSYVTGRVLWGALTMRLTRNASQGPAIDSREYEKVGKAVHENLAFTYFYPALKKGDDYQVVWPWEKESAFRHRFLGSYLGTALSYPSQSAAGGTLHEVEFISPNTLDTGEKVFLKGYVFEKQGCTLNWQSAFKRLQIGGERGYGWGDTELVNVRLLANNQLFDGAAKFKGDSDEPKIHLPAYGRLLAHTIAVTDLPVSGDIEPLVGREWRSDDMHYRYVGQHVAFSDICFAPGSLVCKMLDFAVKKFGMWQSLDNEA